MRPVAQPVTPPVSAQRAPAGPEFDDFVDGDARDAPTGDRVPGARSATEELDESGRDILSFERRWWRRPGAKDQAIREAFGLSPTRYYQRLNALLDEPSALAYDPVLVKRLRRLRASRMRGRSA